MTRACFTGLKHMTMNHTINVSIAGVAFVLDSEGYELLKDYLVRIEVAYKDDPDGAEILSDIEARVSELILNRQSSDMIVSPELIREIIGQLGWPDGVTAQGPAGGAEIPENGADNAISRRLYRNPDGAKLGGVCNGLATYFREYLRGVLTAKKPDKANYRGWQMQKYYEDSLDWENNPLFGWCEKNTKKDGTKYNLYTDGLKIYTTLDSRMQQYAEDAVTEHLKELQGYFFKEKKGAKKAPYTFRLTQEQVDEILGRAMRLSDRYRLMKKAGATEAEIKKAFDTPEEMSVFSWEGEKDTIMTPMDSIRYYKFFLRAGFMSMDPRNGHVKAYVGGPNYHYFQYDMAMVGRRQVGSTIKPFLYTLAMENGFSPCDEVRHVEYTLIDENGKPWTPRNANKKLIGDMVTVKWGLANSDNWITAYLMSKLNPYNLKRLIHTFGVRNRDIVPSVSLCLGPCEISGGEMVSAYTAFPNKGIRVAPLFVTRIEDNDGNVLATFAPEMQEVISVSSAYKMLVMLRAVVNEGSGGRVRRLGVKADMGGKTGTTNYNADGWFMGFTPSLVSGCWVGGDERDIHFGSMTYGQGAAAALPIWAKYMKKVYDDPTLGYDQQEKCKLPEGFDPGAGSEAADGEVFEETGLDDLFN